MPSSLTRLDLVLGLLRILFWSLLIQSLLSALSSSFRVYPAFGQSAGFHPRTSLGTVATSAVPLLILWLFPSVLAHGVLGQMGREPVNSLLDVRPLIGRCLGLSLLTTSLSGALWSTFFVVHNLIISGNVLGFDGRSLGSSLAATSAVSNFIYSTSALVLGFILAFGPAIRGNFRTE
ncbi:MAG: hypothetical protein EOO38_03525 [Cytophagaceae bacterium]|nr:MAG: hypothetical protein EOO38_03525 [Cytophagaceae bacterium]